ncbi:hypothetical protein PENNAL_c0019G03641 [Penicillium nalgiovense]|uniref:Uncharacterized protein n=1 Tax=Penicillium nalgiovense TaxID=60175 RepID=A0A1V6YJJ4_PENNA|nr:hypothetical protein PENNAL_c0019G03641 [Penicillium nalgiovense]
MHDGPKSPRTIYVCFANTPKRPRSCVASATEASQDSGPTRRERMARSTIPKLAKDSPYRTTTDRIECDDSGHFITPPSDVRLSDALLFLVIAFRDQDHQGIFSPAL